MPLSGMMTHLPEDKRGQNANSLLRSGDDVMTQPDDDC